MKREALPNVKPVGWLNGFNAELSCVLAGTEIPGGERKRETVPVGRLVQLLQPPPPPRGKKN